MGRLVRHLASVSTEALAIEAAAERGPRGLLRLRYRLSGAVADVRWPAPGRSERADGLWRTTCLEAFVTDGGGGYVELNLSPTGQWAAYRFSAYRTGMASVEVEPEVEAGAAAEQLILKAEVSLGDALHDGAWRVGLSAVIEGVEGGISYWALAHPGEKPDFHHPDSFVLELPPP